MAVVSIPVRGDPNSDKARAAVERLRADLVPDALTSTDLTGLVGGVTAENIDYTDLINKWLPIVLAFVLGVSLVLLTVLFRSLVLAGTAVVLNLLSVGAAYGLLVLVFQKGYGTGCWASSRSSGWRRGSRSSCSRCCSHCRWTTTSS